MAENDISNSPATQHYASSDGSTMKLIDIQWKPSNRQLWQFAHIVLVVLPIIGWIVSRGSSLATAIFATTGAIVAIIGWMRPQVLSPLFVGLSVITYPIGLIVSEILLLLAFFLVVTPIGLITWFIGRDILQRKIDKSAKSYWQDRPAKRDIESYFKQW